MKKRLARVAPLQLGIVLAVLYGLISLVIFVPIGGCSMLFFNAHHAVGGPSFHGPIGSSAPALMGGIFGGFMLIFLPLLYAAMGFIGGVIAAAIYNVVAKWTGGIEFTVEDAPEQ